MCTLTYILYLCGHLLHYMIYCNVVSIEEIHLQSLVLVCVLWAIKVPSFMLLLCIWKWDKPDRKWIMRMQLNATQFE